MPQNQFRSPIELSSRGTVCCFHCIGSDGCPFCDAEWEQDLLREHGQQRLNGNKPMIVKARCMEHPTSVVRFRMPLTYETARTKRWRATELQKEDQRTLDNIEQFGCTVVSVATEEQRSGWSYSNWRVRHMRTAGGDRCRATVRCCALPGGRSSAAAPEWNEAGRGTAP